MYKLGQIRDIHLEVTSKCQARCPMCPRRLSGGILNPLIDLNEIDLKTFKQWFSPEFIAQLENLFMCGNLGDPIIAQDTLEIFQYIREHNQSMRLSMHTNGSARTQSWWKKLAKLNINVAFGIDGLGDTHALYRINTDWDKIIENAKAYIDAGGEAEWHMLVFKHNEHQIGACQHMADQMGFKKFQVKHTSRFNDNKWHVLDDAGRTTHILEPTQKSIDMIPRVKQAVTNQTPVIQCKAKKYRQIYVAADGTVSPCCWLDFSWILPLQDTRIDYMDNIGVMPSLASNSLAEIFESGYFDKIEATWTDKPLMECSKQCGEFDKLMEQFVEH